MDKYKLQRYAFFLLTTVSIIGTVFYIDSKQKKTNKPIDGAELYKRNCASCHKCDLYFVAPPLKGSLLRWKDKVLLYAFVRNPAVMIEKNKYAMEVFKENKSVLMTSFPHLNDKELDAIFKYCGD